MTSDVALNPPERKQRLSDERVAEIGQAAAAMPHDVPVAGWLRDLCADLLDARVVVTAVAKSDEHDSEGCCVFQCGAPDYHYADHSPDCAWVLARKLSTAA